MTRRRSASRKWHELTLIKRWSLGGAALAIAVATVTFLTVTGWELTQPQATLGTGILAVTAAGIALAGVRFTQAVAISTSKAQLRHQAQVSLRQQRQHEAQMAKMSEVEHEKHRRQTTHDAMIRAIGNLTHARTALTEYHGTYIDMENHGVDPDTISDRLSTSGHLGRLEDSLNALATDASTLLLLGFEDPYKGLHDVTTLSRRWLLGQLEEFDIGAFADRWVKATAALQKAYREI